MTMGIRKRAAITAIRRTPRAIRLSSVSSVLVLFTRQCTLRAAKTTHAKVRTEDCQGRPGLPGVVPICAGAVGAPVTVHRLRRTSNFREKKWRALKARHDDTNQVSRLFLAQEVFHGTAKP